MPIPADEPLVRPAKESVEYASLWLGRWVITLPNPTSKGSLSITEHYYDAESEEVYDGEKAGTIQTSDLMDAVENVPEVKAAYGALLAAAPPLKAYLKAKKETAEAERLAAIAAARQALVEEAAPVETVEDESEPVVVTGNPESVI